jgi:DNA-binding transcriptional LysR family regulator
LRRALGDPLFVRKGQGMEPAPVARDLAVALREILERIELVIAGPAAFDPALAEMSFKIGGSDAIAELLMPSLLRHLEREAPGLRVQLVDLVPDNGARTLEREGVDLALAGLGRRRRVVASLPVFAGMARTVAEGQSVALLPAQLAVRFRDRYELARYRAPMPVPETSVYLCWHRRASSAPGHGWLRAQVLELLAVEARPPALPGPQAPVAAGGADRISTA